ncbi:hypothetical protein ALP25_101857 [Pseudomonas syringae pv. syringae]|nr:hypothetical protein ALP25_101857 [Pseudomonas syringae pv. syringae]
MPFESGTRRINATGINLVDFDSSVERCAVNRTVAYPRFIEQSPSLTEGCWYGGG